MGGRVAIARSIRAVLDAAGAGRVTLELDAQAARALADDLEACEYLRGPQPAYRGLKVTGGV